MTEENDDLTKIVKNYEKFVAFCSKLGDRTASVQALVDHLGDRLVTCPASSRVAFHNAWPGGLVDHSLRVLTLAVKLTKTYEMSFPLESIIISALFHDIGKVGGLTEDHYIPADDWQQKRGQKYTYNPKMQFMSSAHRGLYLLQHFGVVLSEDEFLAILLNDGPEASENALYSMKEPTLAVIIHQADRMACELEKKMQESGKSQG